MQPSVIPRFAMVVFLVALLGLGWVVVELEPHALHWIIIGLALLGLVYPLAMNTMLSMIGSTGEPYQTPGNRCIKFWTTTCTTTTIVKPSNSH